MGSNTTGLIFKITTWGESHGKAIGVVIDGCPAGLEITEAEVNAELALRRPGYSPYTSPRKESDSAEILSGVFEGRSTGAPISIIIHNSDARSESYEALRDILRPGHANFTYLNKYGLFDYRGGGRASARETACRVAAGAVAKKLIRHAGIEVVAYMQQLAEVQSRFSERGVDRIREESRKSPLFCPDAAAASEMIALLEQVRSEGDSLGGVVEVRTSSLPVGLGDPVYEKLEANLAKAMLSLPATKGFEMGAGFEAARMRGSEHNDAFISDDRGSVKTSSNHAGGTLGGISTGMPLCFRVAFKPTSSIRLPQETLDLHGDPHTLQLSEGSRHDPCVAIRAVPVVEAMTALVLADALLMSRCSRL
ncbi:MAG: chorismate synthase [Chlamydiales bacterium]|nr:chorismate synthase [Chlamydiales bacterium]